VEARVVEHDVSDGITGDEIKRVRRGSLKVLMPRGGDGKRGSREGAVASPRPCTEVGSDGGGLVTTDTTGSRTVRRARMPPPGRIDECGGPVSSTGMTVSQVSAMLARSSSPPLLPHHPSPLSPCGEPRTASSSPLVTFSLHVHCRMQYGSRRLGLGPRLSRPSLRPTPSPCRPRAHPRSPIGEDAKMEEM
jgi:hypothetical protein